jgi:hypothetical protein
MKNCIKHFTVIVLFTFSAILMSSCQNDEDESADLLPISSNTISELGGILEAIDGDVQLVVPAGALYEPVDFTVQAFYVGAVTDFVLQPLLIEPVISFAQPVQLILKYDGSLANGVAINGNMCLKACLFNSELDFYTNKMASSCMCEIDYRTRTISLYICHTGVVGLTVDK